MPLQKPRLVSMREGGVNSCVFPLWYVPGLELAGSNEHVGDVEHRFSSQHHGRILWVGYCLSFATQSGANLHGPSDRFDVP